MDPLSPPVDAVLGVPRAEEPGGIAAFVDAFGGLAAGCIIGLLIPSRPPKHALPGFASDTGLDLAREMLRFFLMVALALAGGAIGIWLARRKRVPKHASETSDPLPGGPPASGEGSVGFGLACVCAHAITAWIFVDSGYPGIFGSPGVALAALVLGSIVLAMVLGGGRLNRGVVFLGAASPLLVLAFVGHRPIPFARCAAVAALVLPAVAFALGRRSAEPPRVLRRLTVCVLLPGSFTALAAAACLGVPPLADIFEDGHSLLPASEYLRGELPYRDVVPGHGLLSDGLFDAASLKLFGDDYRGYSRGRKVVGALFWPCFFAMGFAATGSPATGFWALALSFLCFPQYAFPRAIASLATVALATFASRTGKRWAWRACGAALVLDACVSVDFALYAAAAVATALIVARGRRRANSLFLLSGAIPAAVALAVSLAALGVLDDFARTTFRLVPALFPAYAQGFPSLSSSAGIEVPSIPLAGLYGFAALALVVLAAELPRGARVHEPVRAVLPVLAWTVLTMLSVIERWHFGYLFLAVPTALLLLARWFRLSGRAGPLRALVAGAAVAAFASLHSPLGLARAVAGAIQHPLSPPDTAPLDQPRRARGGIFRRWDRTLILRTADMMRRAGFRDGDTWLDFASEPGLYFLFDRPCPIRYYEVAFYESEEAQQEVIDTIARDTNVRAALISAVYPPIDGIANAVRAPRVYEFLRRRFRPFFQEDGVEYWLRDPTEEQSGQGKRGP